MDTEIIKITDVSVKHNVTVFRGHLKQKSDEQMKFEVCKTEEDTSADFNTTKGFSNMTHSKFEQISCQMKIDGIGKKTTRTEDSPPKHNTLTRRSASK
ncbi:unnamed protein product [Fasciola hepatica]|uniref:Uncharacterized protein n=1 Tax=Fasciola hepatica TaxID=6192 RepID=A0ABC9HG64_FASHE